MLKGNSANSTYIQQMNKKLILKCIMEEDLISRASISKKLSISKPTVSTIVDQLLEEEWVYETGVGEVPKKGGRRPVNLRFNPQKGYIIGVDIGGTKVAVGITDLSGKVYDMTVFPTKKIKGERLFDEIKTEMEQIRERLQISESKLMGMGVGVPGIVNVESGTVIEAPALEWNNFPILDELKSRFNLPIFVDNDVNISVLGEHWKGIGRKKDNLIYIAIGTGIGSGIMINGDLYRGKSYAAGEIGYMVTDRTLAKNYHPVFDGYGFLESVSGGLSIGEQLSKRLGRKVEAKEAFELYLKKDHDAMKVIDIAIENLSLGIANYISLLDPELIILGGGVSESYHVISNKMQDIIQRFTPRKCDVVQTTFGEEAGVIGAVALFLREYDSVLNI
ncbi:ROK family transcriptional regulator [Oceanobacillus caeni]|uniref:ROK family transcriptional regulator n=1 Tax=Oceanobacillus caeni TaxID=405946 RepID=UPI002149E5DC|nr:ROK family transcriptional regulator [Oceanobacillus caeni]MCR1834581.1 ROK family transcriptional regulator [Oceanobacillus caeni]